MGELKVMQALNIPAGKRLNCSSFPSYKEGLQVWGACVSLLVLGP